VTVTKCPCLSLAICTLSFAETTSISPLLCLLWPDAKQLQGCWLSLRCLLPSGDVPFLRQLPDAVWFRTIVYVQDFYFSWWKHGKYLTGSNRKIPTFLQLSDLSAVVSRNAASPSCSLLLFWNGREVHPRTGSPGAAFSTPTCPQGPQFAVPHLLCPLPRLPQPFSEPALW